MAGTPRTSQPAHTSRPLPQHQGEQGNGFNGRRQHERLSATEHDHRLSLLLDARDPNAERWTVISTLPDDPEAALLEIGARVFAPLRATPAVWAFWWPRFKRIARWFAGIEGGHRHELVQAWSEVKGELTIDAASGPFVLSAKADRIDRQADGTLILIDYKTGALPKPGDVKRGAAPQLPLEAVIAAKGSFAAVPRSADAQLQYWRLTGGEPAGEVKPLADPAGLAERAYGGLCRLIELFDDEATAYQALPRRDWAPAYNDYLHLARAKEWDVSGGGAGT